MNEHSAQPGHALAASRAVCLVGSNHGRCNDEDGGFDDRISVVILTPLIVIIIVIIIQRINNARNTNIYKYCYRANIF